MSNDKALADRVVALGIDGLTYIEHGTYCDDWVRSFLRDARVAMALMERCLEVDQIVIGREPNGTFWCDLPTRYPFDTHGNDSLPRAIIEAAVTALEQE